MIEKAYTEALTCYTKDKQYRTFDSRQYDMDVAMLHSVKVLFVDRRSTVSHHHDRN